MRRTITRSLSLCLLIALAHALQAQSNYQLVMDTSITTGRMVDHGLQTAGGSQVLGLQKDADVLVYRFDPTGQPEWARRLTYNGEIRRMTMSSDGAEGFYVAAALPSENYTADWSDPDTLVEHFEVAHIDAGGGLIWSGHFARTQVYSSTLFHLAENLFLAPDASGDLFLQIDSRSYWTFEDWYPQILRFDGSGALLWTVYVGHDGSQPDELPGVTGEATSGMTLMVDGSGGLFLGPAFDHWGPTNDVSMIQLDATGMPLWANRYEYVPSLIYAGVRAMTIDADGRIVVESDVAHGGGDFLYSLRLQPTGTPDRADLYEKPFLNERGEVHTAANGQVCTISNGWGDPVIMRVDVNADPVTSWMAFSVEHPLYNYGFGWLGSDLQQDRLSLVGDLSRFDLGLGVSTHWPALQMIDLNAPSHCLLNTMSNAHTLVPISLITVEPLTDIVSEDASGALTVEIPSLVIAPTAMIDVLDACSLLVGLEEESMIDPEVPRLESSLISAGAPLHVFNVRPGKLTVMDAAGRVLQDIEQDGAQDVIELQTNGSSGLYLLRWSAADGSRTLVQRFVIQ